MRTSSYITIAPERPEGENASSTTSASQYSGVLVIKEPKEGEEKYDVINKLPVSKLFLVLMMVVYGISAYAKGKNGVSNHDLSMIMAYSIFVTFTFIFLHISTYLYRAGAAIVSWEGLTRGMKTFLKRYWFGVLFSILIVLILLLNYVYIDKAVEKAINKSVNLKEHYGR